MRFLGYLLGLTGLGFGVDFAWDLYSNSIALSLPLNNVLGDPTALVDYIVAALLIINSFFLVTSLWRLASQRAAHKKNGLSRTGSTGNLQMALGNQPGNMPGSGMDR